MQNELVAWLLKKSKEGEGVTLTHDQLKDLLVHIAHLYNDIGCLLARRNDLEAALTRADLRVPEDQYIYLTVKS